MFPSKNMMDYMTEMNRLFSRNESEIDPLSPFSFNTCPSPFQSTTVNRSSSSTDSTSPESYPDLSFHSINSQRLQETPKARAIVGRKILGSSHSSLMSPVERMEANYSFWQHEEPLSETPPERMQQSHNLYELFPKEQKDFVPKTPVKAESAAMLELTPKFPDRSPWANQSSPLSNQSLQSMSFSNQSIPNSMLSPSCSSYPRSSVIPPQRKLEFTSNYNPCYLSKKHHFAGTSSDEIAPSKICTFCRKNGETPIVYMTHCVKEQVGNKHVVTCPILRSHVCSTCGATGDNAHTITYCPVLRINNNGKPLQSTTITLKNTRIKSNGRRRY